MKNKFVFLTSLVILFISVLGCSYYNPLQGNSNTAVNDNRTISDKAIDSTIGEQKIGVPECDEIIDFFAEQYKSPDDDFITKAAREFALNQLRDSFKKSLEEHKGDKVAMAKNCREFKTQLDKYKTEEANKKP
jgi:hypothetical protein